MGKTALKLYRDPEQAKAVLKELTTRGYTLAEISVVAGPQSAGRIGSLGDGVTLELTQGKAVAIGAVARGLSSDGKALREALGIAEDTFTYYQFGLAMGAVLVAVHGDEARLAQARRILRHPEGLEVEKTKSPGFERAARMTESDPIDAKMTGDFRRY